MIEKRMMGYFDMDYPDEKSRTVMVYQDTDTNEVCVYSLGDELYEAYDNDRFFPTVEEAERKREEYRKELVKKVPEVRRLLRAICYLEPAKDESDPMYFDKDSIVPNKMRSSGNSDYFREQRDIFERRTEALVAYIRTGYLNICGTNIRKEDVVRVYWGRKCAELCFKDGKPILTKGDFEMWLVGVIFGRNESGFTMTRLNEITGDKED